MTRDPAREFGAVAADYAGLRPRYPAALFEFLEERLEGPRRTCIDLGAGPGKASADLAARFARVIAVEPDERMIAAMPPHNRIERILASAETVDFPAGSIDCVTAATSFHWMDQDAVCANAARWLRPRGVFFPFLYGPFFVEGPAQPAFQRHFALWAPFMDRRIGAKADYAQAMRASGAFSRLEPYSASFGQTMPPDEASGLLLTASYARAYMADARPGGDYRRRLADELSPHGPITVGFALSGVLGVRSD